MDVILLQTIDKLGEKHEVVTVKNGYGRNFLIPQKKALIANDTNMRRLDDLRKREERRELKMSDHYKAMATSLEGKVLKIGAKAGAEGKIFGSVTNIQIASAMKDQLGIELERRKITVPDDVKVIGTYDADLNLHPEVQAKVKFEVVKE